MNDKALISVIVPVYNGERYIQECLDSLTAQTFPYMEIIIVDDGSTDGSAEICKKYTQKYPQVFRYYHIPNSGQSVARNVGLDHAVGKYIAFCDADDAYAPHAFECLISKMDVYDIAASSFVRQKSQHFKWDTSPSFQEYDSHTAIENLLYQRPAFNTSCWGKLFRAELFDNVRFEEGLYYEDIEIIPRLFSKARKIAVTKSRLYFYRQNPSSFISTWHPKRLDTIKACQKVYDFIQANHPQLLPAARSRRFSAYFNMFVETTRHNNDEAAMMCFDMIKKDRRDILADSKVRIKNKIGALASYLGKSILTICLKPMFRQPMK